MQEIDFSNLERFADKVKVLLISDMDDEQFYDDSINFYEIPNENEVKCFRKFKNVERMKLDFNHITNIDKPLFNSFENLKNLDIEFLAMDNLPECLFTDLTKLKDLSLGLKGAKLNKNHFTGLDNLETLDLWNVELDDDLDCLVNLKKLKLEKVKSNKFTLKGLKHIKEFKLVDFKFNMEEPFISYLWYFLQNLKILKSLEIAEFNPSAYNIMKEDYVLFSLIIERMPTSLKNIKFNSVYFEILNSIANTTPFIHSLKKVEIIVVNEQEDIKEFSLFKDNMFQNLESLSLHLYARDPANSIDLSVEKFKKLDNLKSLNLNGIVLVGVDNEFNYLTEANFHIRIPENMSNFFNLKKLSLTCLNEKISINEKFLEDLVYLEELFLYDVFDSIDPDATYLFKSLINLKKLKLQKNKMAIVKSSYFDYLVNLEDVNLKNNEIKVIESDSFKNSTKLKYLSLSENPLEGINKDTFILNPNLEKIVLLTNLDDF